jgi:signal transduction histidine kinase
MDGRWWRLASGLTIAFIALTAAVGAASGAPLRFSVLDTLGALAFVVAGAIAWQRRPDVLTGPILVGCAVLWSIGSYGPTMQPVVTHVGFALSSWYDVALALLVLALPARWPDPRGRRLVAILAAAFGVRSLGRLLLQDPSLYPDAVGVPPNPFAIAPDLVAFETVEVVASAVIAVCCLIVAGIATARLVAGSRATRRVLWPVLVTGVVAMLAAAVAAADVARATATGQPLFLLPEPWSEVASWTSYAARVLIPLGFLVGTLRTRIAAGPIVPLAAEVGRLPSPTRMEAALQAALGDPTVRLLRRDPTDQSWVDADGHHVPLPEEGSTRAVTRLESGGSPIAAIVHDPVLREDPSLIGAVTAVLRLGVQNERLEAEVRAQLDAVRASRVRLVGAAEEERRKLERDLHDGAQQRLVGVSLALQRARAAADEPTIPATLREELDRTAAELHGAITELRELARGIHPAILEDEGLPAAVASLARRAGIPVELEIAVDGRLPRSVETTAYFAIAESLTNVARYARAGSARVSVVAKDERLHIVVEDDGVGGADPTRGTGLRGVADRIGALDGRFDLRSPMGGGTRISAEIPVP